MEEIGKWNIPEELRESLMCAICLDPCSLPVTMDCGHTFCKYCIAHKRLLGKTCPVCRGQLGTTLNVNVTLKAILESYGVHSRHTEAPQSQVVLPNKRWWQNSFVKPRISLPLFLKIFLGPLNESVVFMHDTQRCLIDFLEGKWTIAKWVFTEKECETFCHAVNWNQNDLEASHYRLKRWVQEYVSAKPALLVLQSQRRIILRILSDRVHKIEERTFDSNNIQVPLPWDAGRHGACTVLMEHPSVSLSHLTFVEMPEVDSGLGCVDCGSTLGTMVKIEDEQSLQDGDLIHIGDRLEYFCRMLPATDAACPYTDCLWSSEQSCVVPSLENPSLPVEGVPLDSQLQLSSVAGEDFVDPRGVILGRGPHTSRNVVKLSVTDCNGYVSREHCHIMYNGNLPAGSRWTIKDVSTLGTYLRMPSGPPIPLPRGCIFKVGQCKIEVGPSGGFRKGCMRQYRNGLPLRDPPGRMPSTTRDTPVLSRDPSLPGVSTPRHSMNVIQEQEESEQSDERRSLSEADEEDEEEPGEQIWYGSSSPPCEASQNPYYPLVANVDNQLSSNIPTVLPSIRERLNSRQSTNSEEVSVHSTRPHNSAVPGYGSFVPSRYHPSQRNIRIHNQLIPRQRGRDPPCDARQNS
eukprot:Platyproteum_vivax@DN5296_c0_g1_i2.p1